MKRFQPTLSAFVVGFILFAHAIGQEKDAEDSSPKAPSKVARKVSDEELKQLEAEAAANPGDRPAQLNLAKGYFEKGMLSESWKKLRSLYDETPKDLGVLLGMESVVDAYRLRGAMDVGVPEKQVTDLLGNPHLHFDMPWGKRLVYGVMAIDFREEKIWELVKLAGATEELFDSSLTIEVDLGASREWKIKLRQKGDGKSTAFAFPKGESIARWTEMVTIERWIREAEGKSLKDVLENVRTRLTKDSSTLQFAVVEQDDESAIFGVLEPARDSLPAMQQVVRLWMGPRDVFRLAYTHQGDVPSQKEAEKWLAILRSAKLKTYDPSVSKTSQAFSPRNQVTQLAEALRFDLKKALPYKPTEEVIRAIAADEASREKLQAYCDTVYGELDQAGAAAKANQTDIVVFGPSLDELPGGYKNSIEHFKPSVKFYGFKYVAPGEKLGMSFDGVFEVGGKWYFLPKAHRAFR